MNVTSEYFSDKKANANKQFNHFTGVDENCQAFNNKNMWDLDQENSFSGFKKEGNDSGFNNTCGNSFSGNKTIDQTLNAAGGRKRHTKRGGAATSGARAARVGGGAPPIAAKQKQVVGGRDCTPPKVWCQVGDYHGCNPSHKCNGGRVAQMNPMKNVSGRTSRRGSADRISNKPVMGTAIKSSFSAAEKVFPYGTGNNFGGEASARCGLDR